MPFDVAALPYDSEDTTRTRENPRRQLGVMRVADLCQPVPSTSFNAVALNGEQFYYTAPPKAYRPETRLVPLAEWEGVVQTVDASSETFVARLVDQRTDNEIEYATFEFSEISEDDRDLIRSGGIFRWVIGKRQSNFGSVENTSKLIFRRLPGYSRSDVMAAEARAADWADTIQFE